MADFQLYPEQTNRGVCMKDVSKDMFVPEVVTTEQTGDVLLLKEQQYPWCVMQIDMPKDMDEFRRHLNAAQQQGWAEYVEGRYDHIAFHRGNWQHVELTQANAQQVADDIHESIRNAARWWCMYYMQ